MSEPVSPRGRRVFVGDVHGCLAQLDALLDKVGFRPGIDRLLPVGDLVAKGPDSPGVLRRCIDLGAEPVLGNHDLTWLRMHRIEDPTLRDWLAEQPIVRLFEDLILVHAGLHPRWSEAELGELQDGQIDYAVLVRYCDEHGRRPRRDWPVPEEQFRPWDAFYRGSRRVVFGHWARRGLDVTERVVALDSGCVYGGRLSAWVAEEDRVVQVDGLR